LHLRQERRRYELVVDSILELVEARNIQPGQALPTERELADTFGVSRNVLRQAFSVLDERGILRTIRGSGRYLRDVAAGPAGQGSGVRMSMELASIADILEARTLIEMQVVELACQRRTSKQAMELRVLASRLESWEDNLTFHCAIAAATQNFVLERLVRQQSELAGELHQRQHYQDPEQLDRMREEHAQIARAVAARDTKLARELVHDHLHRTREVMYGQGEAE
jgi:DNA-binding FadR family transcriptional regulator